MDQVWLSSFTTCFHQLFNLSGGVDLLFVVWSLRTQDMLKSKLILEDDFVWRLPSVGSSSGEDARDKFKYIGGTDISFLKEDPSTACAAVVVLDADTLEVVHEEFDVVRLQVPYIPGFLAFREVLGTVACPVANYSFMLLEPGDPSVINPNSSYHKT